MEQPANVLMERDGQRTEVANNKSIQIMEGLGWKVVDATAAAPAGNRLLTVDQLVGGPLAPADMTAAQLKAELTAAGIAFKGNASKADLAELVTEARAKA